jgi:hypothetical protein
LRNVPPQRSQSPCMTIPRSSPTWCARASTLTSSPEWPPLCPGQSGTMSGTSCVNTSAAAKNDSAKTQQNQAESKRCPLLVLRLRPLQMSRTKRSIAVFLLPYFLLLLRNSEEQKGRKRSKPANAERECSRARRSAKRNGNLLATSATTIAKSKTCGLSLSIFGSACRVVGASNSIGGRPGATACGSSHRKNQE